MKEMNLLARLKQVVSRFYLLDNYCRHCGRKTEAYTVPNELWQHITNGSEPLCFRCFDEASKRRGIFPVWKVVLD